MPSKKLVENSKRMNCNSQNLMVRRDISSFIFFRTHPPRLQFCKILTHPCPSLKPACRQAGLSYPLYISFHFSFLILTPFLRSAQDFPLSTS